MTRKTMPPPEARALLLTAKKGTAIAWSVFGV